MNSRYEPGPTGDYGSGGIAREGMDERYSTALWRDNPEAFWLHPEGPLADSTPGEFFEAEPPELRRSYLSIYAGGVTYPNSLQNPYANALQNAANSGYAGMLNQRAAYPLGLGGLLGLF